MADKVWVMVDTALLYRIRYMIEAPKDHPEYALDNVTMETAKEFSQLYVGEQIMNHRVLTEEEALQQCNIDNEYSTDWATEHKLKTFFTKEGETREL